MNNMEYQVVFLGLMEYELMEYQVLKFMRFSAGQVSENAKKKSSFYHHFILILEPH